MNKLTVLIVCLLACPFVFSQNKLKEFTLQQAIEFAIENNRVAKNSALDIEAAQKQKWETTAIGLPQISATFDYQNWLKQQVSLLPGEVVGEDPGTFVPLVFGTKQSLNASATLSQLLFDGSYLVGLQSAKVFLEISKNAKEKTDLEVRKGVINAYGNVLLAEESVKILERNKTVLEKNLNEVTKLYENGLDEQESVEQLQITLSSVKSNLKNTTRLKGLAYQMLNLGLGLDVYDKIILSESLEELTKDNINLNLLENNNDVKNTVDYKIAYNDRASKELLLKLEKSKALPKLSAFVNGGYIGNSDTFTFANKDQQWFGFSLLGLSLDIPIFSSGMRSASTQRAKINLVKSENDLTETEQQLQMQLESAKSNYQFSIEEFNNKTRNLNLAERIEKKNQTKYFEGIGSSFELHQAQTQLYSAQQELLQSMLDVINNKAELETILNTPNN